ncbi:HypC/HybG/HupF family hydrogenase formation chaperone, partial [Turicimonas muris]
MCIGIPMIVKELPDEGVAICEGRGLREKIDIMMVGPLEPGTWILA